MKFVGEVLGGIEGIQNFYIVGLLIFIGLFIMVVYRTVRIPKKDLIGFKTSIFEENELAQEDKKIIKK